MEPFAELDVITFAALSGHATDARRLRRRASRGEVVRVHRGAFADTAVWQALPADERYAVRCVAAASASRSDPVLSHASALATWGVPLLWTPRLVHVLASQSSGTRTEGAFRRHAVGDLERDVVAFGSVRRTSLIRSLVEFAADAPLEASVAAIDHCLHVGVVARAGLLDAADLVTGAGRRRFEHALELSDPLSESVGESRSRVVIARLGFPAPECQRAFVIDGRRYRTDFWWEEGEVAGEFDGVGKYLRSSPAGDVGEAIVREKRREDAIRRYVSGFARWGWAELEHPAALARILSDAGVTRAIAAHPGRRARPVAPRTPG